MNEDKPDPRTGPVQVVPTPEPRWKTVLFLVAVGIVGIPALAGLAYAVVVQL